MGGRTVMGRDHESHCEFPWHKCTCTPVARLEELTLLATQKLDGLSAILKEMEEIKNEQQQPA